MEHEWIKLHDGLDHYIVLRVSDATPDDPYILKAADGLGPPEFDISMAGATLKSRRPQGREVSFLISLNPDYTGGQTMDELKEALYLFVDPAPERLTYIIFGWGDPTETWVLKTWLYLQGFVKTMTPAKFTKDPVFQIVFTCRYPYYLRFTNIGLSPGELALLDPLAFDITPPGNAPTQFAMNVTFTADKTEYWVEHDSGKRLHLEYDFEIGDTLTIATAEDGVKSIQVNPVGVDPTVSILWALTDDSEWFSLHPGINHITTSTDDVTLDSINAFGRWWGI